ncbi:MAG TPA: hypothetical protein VLH08_08770 [Acidobacteriota bacterium]|nr:hypothetical protein [Acidobacteriota bacterium]
MHAAAFKKAAAVLDSVTIPAFYANSFKALWLIDSATLITVAAAFIMIAWKPAFAGRWIIIVLALIPAATSALIYKFVGSFLPAHLLLSAAVLAVIAAFQHP